MPLTARVAPALASLLLFAALPAQALVVTIDSFSAVKNGGSLFSDEFDNNSTPSQESSAYTVNSGAFPIGAEASGRLTLNTDWGGISTNALGQTRQSLITTRLTNINPTNEPFGMRLGDSLAVTGIFDLVTPTGPLGNAYGIRVSDSVLGQAAATRILQLDVAYDVLQASAVVRLLLQDFVGDTISILGSSLLTVPGGASQIQLTLSKGADTSMFTGAFAFVSNGIAGSSTSFASGGAMFDKTNYVRSQFFASTALAVPEPGSVVLALLALGALGASRRFALRPR